MWSGLGRKFGSLLDSKPPYIELRIVRTFVTIVRFDLA